MIDFDLVLVFLILCAVLTIWIVLLAIRLDSLREDVDDLRKQTMLQHRIIERNIKEMEEGHDD